MDHITNDHCDNWLGAYISLILILVLGFFPMIYEANNKTANIQRNIDRHLD